MSTIPTNFDGPIAPSASNIRPKVLCHCLQITQQQVVTAIDCGAARTVKDVMRETGAGSGCTACHCTIRSMLQSAGFDVQCGGRYTLPMTDEPAAMVG